MFIPNDESYLHSVILENNKDEFSKAFENWFDIEFLMEFFEANIKDLESGFYGQISVEDATADTRKEAKVSKNN